jgi:hypothetical protein
LKYLYDLEEQKVEMATEIDIHLNKRELSRQIKGRKKMMATKTHSCDKN